MGRSSERLRHKNSRRSRCRRSRWWWSNGMVTSDSMWHRNWQWSWLYTNEVNEPSEELVTFVDESAKEIHHQTVDRRQGQEDRRQQDTVQA